MIKKEQGIELDQGGLNPDKLPPGLPLPLVEAFSAWDRAQNWDEGLGLETPERDKELCFTCEVCLYKKCRNIHLCHSDLFYQVSNFVFVVLQ